MKYTSIRRDVPMIRTDLTGVMPFVDDVAPLLKESDALLRELSEDPVKYFGSGWLHLPETYDAKLLDDIKHTAAKIAAESQALVVIGIGGSYLGARAALDFIKTPYYNQHKKQTPDIYFVGNNLSGEYLEQVIAFIGDRDFSVNYISKSGSTLEPSVAFRVMKSCLSAKYGSLGAKKRIYVTTDSTKGHLRHHADREGYKSFTIPDDIGGRYSVLTAVGLLPAACAGIDIDAMLCGARDMMGESIADALSYAVVRQTLYRKGKKIEMLACFEPSFRSMGEWWKQLFGESEGKDGIGIFPAYSAFTTDLHSMGQYIQSGERTIFETLVSIRKPRSELRIPRDSSLDDGLDALVGRDISTLNDAALKATKQAHIEGGVPVIELVLPTACAYEFGALVQFFEVSCAVSALLSKVNPFDQPGVEAYKKNLFAILGLEK